MRLYGEWGNGNSDKVSLVVRKSLRLTRMRTRDSPVHVAGVVVVCNVEFHTSVAEFSWEITSPSDEEDRDSLNEEVADKTCDDPRLEGGESVA